MKKISPRIIFILGCLAVAVSFIPYLILGQDGIFIYHDQLDGEVIAYLLHARHLGETGPFPEFMGGAARTALTPPAPLFVLLYSVLPAHISLALMQLIGSFVGYVGMYLLVRALWKWIKAERQVTAQKQTDAREQAGAQKRTDAREQVGWTETFVAVTVSVMFAYLPFLPVYGLSQYGLPLLAYSMLCICGAKKSGCPCEMSSWKGIAKNFLPWAYVVIYGLGSSLVLCGFGVLLVGVVTGMWMMIAGRKAKLKQEAGAQNADTGRKCPLKLLLATGLLLVTYMIENIPLIQQMLLGQGVVSHKEEYVLHGAKFLPTFVENLASGKVHTNDFHHLFLIGIVISFVVFLIAKRNVKLVKVMGAMLATAVCIAFVSALWDSNGGVALRENMGGLGSFQLNRLLWMTPVLWYLLLALALLGALCRVQATRIIDSDFDKTQEQKRCFVGRDGWKRVILPGALFGILVVMTLYTGIKVLWGSHLKPNAIKAVNGYYDAISFSDYYAVGVLEQVEAYLRETTGKEQGEYRVVSFGIDPAAALYHGFYCLDGYSNNYDVEYKQAFRKIIAPELDRNDYIRQNFDDWGNRCYLFSSECPGYYTIEKGGFYLKDYQIDTQALVDLAGADCYLFSAAYIENGSEQGLTLLRELPFETKDGYYRIFLYQVAAK